VLNYARIGSPLFVFIANSKKNDAAAFIRYIEDDTERRVPRKLGRATVIIPILGMIAEKIVLMIKR
jgi:hypothetical protein